ncbi:hypothetical protein Leryth_006376 [Lithospermum erythrorhizon]|nr:hypothetical protein Leryth_006376 [Lithospermum erythrorhizon]
MRGCFVFVFSFLFSVLVFLGVANELLINSPENVIGRSVNGGLRRAPARRSLLSDSKEPETALVAALDGTIYLLELGNSTEIGSSYFIDCGDDWELYAHSKLGKLKLMQSFEEYISSTPQISEDGGIVLGSKKTTAFLVNAKTGKLMRKYEVSDSSSSVHSNKDGTGAFNSTTEDQEIPASTGLRTDEHPLYITRTDYALTSFAPSSNKVLWNVTVAEIGAAFLCPDMENSFVEALWKSDSLDPGPRFSMPLPCQSRAMVYRFRSQNVLEHFSLPMELPDSYPPDIMLSETKDNDVFPPELNGYKVLESLPAPENIDNNLESQSGSNGNMALPVPSSHDTLSMADRKAEEISQTDKTSRLSERLSAFHMVLSATIFVGIVSFQCGQRSSRKDEPNPTEKNVHSKKKRTRKSGKNKDSSAEDEIKNLETESDRKLGTNLILGPSELMDGRSIGKLFLSNKEIAKGSNGTIVLEGIYEGRPVAVKRLVRAHHDIAYKEIQNLIASDRHPNIVRWYGVEQDQDFVYISLERCICSLHDLILTHSESMENPTIKGLGAEALAEQYENSIPLNDSVLDDKLWRSNGYPSPILLKIMREVVCGLVHLHELGIIHRDLKPQNVLVIKDRTLCAKLSDMGISKRLVGDMSSLGHHATGCGSSGWQAPEQLLHGRQTRAVDLFSLGSVIFFCITGGRHPFGNRLERDINIAKNKVDLFLVEHIPEAVDLLSHLLDPYAEFRPKAREVLAHPLFWTADTRLSFLRDTSDRVELEDRENSSELLKALESVAPVALGGKWDEKMEPAFINNIGRYRRYKFECVRDLLRVMRNKLNHYRELPTEIQEILGAVPEGFDGKKKASRSILAATSVSSFLGSMDCSMPPYADFKLQLYIYEVMLSANTCFLDYAKHPLR